ncbi:caspase family protein [Candidatus Marithrix sp. Canyon 246]|uniref:caspase family protein n=1 Tax=Candidatus Marithrix sp. Canyon 246 TaxID=1827136 RepID=UPI001C0B9DBB|nr:caspase family protein [Candidatus Marithrix sp. Canyon 246]
MILAGDVGGTLFYSILLGISTIINTCNAENRALLVGIDKYQYINPLIGSKNDADAMAKFIQSEWGLQKLPIWVQKKFAFLVKDLQEKGPEQPTWQNYSKLD